METVARFREYPSAYLACGRLRSEDIPAWVVHENLPRIAWHYSDAVGGVKLQVEVVDVDRAQEALAVDWSDAIDTDPRPEAEVCPRCGSLAVTVPRFRYHPVLAGVLAGASLLLAGPLLLLLLPTRRDWHCESCGRMW